MEAFRKTQMEATRKLVAREKANFINCYRDSFAHYKQEAPSFPILDKRTSVVSVRSSLVFLVYDYLTALAEKEHLKVELIPQQELTKVGLLTDASMSVMYLYNHLYDGKSENRSRSRRTASRVVNNANKLTYAICNYVKTFPDHYRDIIVCSFSRAMVEVEDGQGIDVEYGYKEFAQHIKEPRVFEDHVEDRLLLIANIIEELHQKYPTVNKDVFWNYFNRIYLINSSLLREVTNVILELTKFNNQEDKIKEEKAKKLSSGLLDFVQLYGMMLQVVNDISDFVFDVGTSSKQPEDTLSDLRNGTISLPIMLHYFKGGETASGVVNAYIKQQIESEDDAGAQESNELIGKHNQVMKELMESDAIGESRVIAKDLAYISRKFITKIKGTADCKSPSAHLRALTSIVDRNRYYWHLNKAKEYYNNGLFYRAEDYPSKEMQEISRSEDNDDATFVYPGYAGFFSRV